MPDVEGLTSDEEAGEGEEGDEMEEEVVVEEAHLRMPSPILAFSSSSSSSSSSSEEEEEESLFKADAVN